MPGMIDHIDLRVLDLGASRSFYEAVLEPLGIHAEPERTDPAGGRQLRFTGGNGVEFSLHEPTPYPGQDIVTTGAHIAFLADGEGPVRAFHAAGVALGAAEIGGPGPRPKYGDDYYGAFLLDPDGNNVEAVWYRRPARSGPDLPGSLEP